jgi:HK97 gp10 family phage protein
MTRDVRVVVHKRGVEQLKHHPKVQDKQEATSHAIARRAAVLAPKDTGEGAASIHAEQQSDGTWRVAWDVEHYYMFFPEFGTEHQFAQPFMRPAADEFR